ncbi:hypothetical protein LINPERHAP1_LOCUS12268, partial [Linum perenne]
GYPTGGAHVARIPAAQIKAKRKKPQRYQPRIREHQKRKSIPATKVGKIKQQQRNWESLTTNWRLWIE